MSEDLCIPSRANTLTGTGYTAWYLEQQRARYAAEAEPRPAVEVERYFRPVVDAPEAVSPTVRRVCRETRQAWATPWRVRSVPIIADDVPILVEDWPVRVP